MTRTESIPLWELNRLMKSVPNFSPRGHGVMIFCKHEYSAKDCDCKYCLYRGRLFGKIECSLKEPLTDAETEILKEWIIGQNADGYGEHFEQQPIDTEDGDLYVSFWNSGDDYSIMTHDELDEYIEDQGMTMGGM